MPIVDNWVTVVTQRYAQFQGRAGRGEFWWFVLAQFIIGIIMSILISLSDIFWIVYVVWALALIIPSIALGVRRLHDTGKTGWWYLIAFIPFGVIVLIVFWAMESNPGDNMYGAPAPPVS